MGMSVERVSRLALGICVGLAACSGEPRVERTQPINAGPPRSFGGSGGSNATATAGSGSFGNPMTTPPPPPVRQPTATGGVGGGSPDCGSSETAMNRIQPVDIIIGIDQSGSMDEETRFVQQQINSFSQRILESGIDVHVALVATRPGANSGGMAGMGGGGRDNENPICVPPPLGGEDCADNAPVFMQLDLEVGSHDVWDRILEAFPRFQPILRPEAKKHVLVITDDTPEGVTGDGFSTMLASLDPGFGSYVHHAIYAFTAPDELGCAFGTVMDTCCGLAAGAGTAYGQLSEMRGGISANLCEQNFEAVWTALATQVVQAAELTCEWAIPPPPDGQVFNAEKVNVSYSAEGVAAQAIGWVDGEAACANVSHGWFFDTANPPTKVFVCPQTCTTVENLTNPAVAVSFGCDRIIAPPE